jgi:hypothetical protein
MSCCGRTILRQCAEATFGGVVRSEELDEMWEMLPKYVARLMRLLTGILGIVLVVREEVEISSL